MNKFIIVIATTLLLGSTGSLMAQDDVRGEPFRQGQGQGHRHHAGKQAMPMVGGMMRAIRQLDLTEQQDEDIRTVMQGMKESIRPVMEQTRAGHMALRELVKADVYDEEAVAVLAAKEGDLAAERVLITSKAMSEVLGLLTDEQRAELDTMAANRKAMRAEKRKQKNLGS